VRRTGRAEGTEEKTVRADDFGPSGHKTGRFLNSIQRCRPPAALRGVEDLDIKRSGSRSTSEGPADWFSGEVRIELLFEPTLPGRAQGQSVTFEPGARNHWHTHPAGQALIVTAGEGLVQAWGGPVEHVHPGDVVYFAPQEKHWHGASPDSRMTHIAIQEEIDGKVVDWIERGTSAPTSPSA
jgi:quercetin dioxygenase-like cupin family protein